MSYNFNSLVNKSEAEALKKMIFERTKERSKSYTDDAHADVMDLARESFVSKGNPFSKIIEQGNKVEKNNTQVLETNTSVEVKSESNDIGFPQRKINNNFVNQNSLIKEQIAQSAIQNTMIEARETLSNNKSFMGALNFLNSQAAVSLMRTRADRFEVIG